MYNPTTAGLPDPGSQVGSQRRQTPSDARRRRTTIDAARWRIGLCAAKTRDGKIAPEKRKVGGLTPHLTTHPEFQSLATG
jgi:hypothetical protein